MSFHFSPLYLTTPLALITQLVLPVSLAFFFIRRYRSSWKMFFVGVLCYLGAQLLRLPLVMLIRSLAGGEGDLPLWLQLSISAVVLALVTALAETAARFFGISALRAENRSWGGVMTLAVGMGGMDALVNGVVSVYNFVFLFNLRENGLGQTTLQPEEVTRILAQIEQYWSAPWYSPLATALIYALFLFLSLVVSAAIWVAIERGSRSWLLGAGVWQAVFFSILLLGGALELAPLLIVFLLLVLSAANYLVIKRLFALPVVQQSIESL